MIKAQKKQLKSQQTQAISFVKEVLHPELTGTNLNIREMSSVLEESKSYIELEASNLIDKMKVKDVINFADLKRNVWIDKDKKQKHVHGKEIFNLIFKLKDLPILEARQHLAGYNQNVNEHIIKKITDTPASKIQLKQDEITNAISFEF